MDFIEATASDEAWLGQHVPLIPPGAARAMVKRLRGDWKQWKKHVR